MISPKTPDLASQIYQALQNLHDFVFLQKLPLVHQLSAPNGTLEQGVRRLRAEILEAIERLNPTQNMPSRARQRRPYAILYGYYVQGMTTRELADELAISVRQLRREHARAVDAVLILLLEKIGPKLTISKDEPSPPLETGRHQSVEAETSQLIRQSHIESLDVKSLVEGIFSTLRPLADARGMSFAAPSLADLLPVRANRVVLRQGLLGLVSAALQHFSNGKICVEAKTAQNFCLWILAEGDCAESDPVKTKLDVSQKLIASLGGRVEIISGATRRIEVSIPAEEEETYLLVMDDNPGLVELYRRYLAGSGYRLVEAQRVEEAISLAEKHRVRLIILDVMMPQQDGWEVLQRLRETEATRNIPVMICSVLDEAEIAAALGCSDYLKKPVTQDALLAKVERWCQVVRQNLAT